MIKFDFQLSYFLDSSFDKIWPFLQVSTTLRQECNIAHMNLNSRTDSIMLTMLERMRLTSCVLSQRNALNVLV